MEKSQRIAFDIDKAELDTKVVTRDGHSGKIDSIDLTKPDYPISATIELDGKEVPLIFTKEGHFYSNNRDSMFDLFLEEVDTKCTENKKLAPNQDSNISNRAIVYENLNGDEGFHKVHLDYLNKDQVEVIKCLVEAWNKEKKELNKINKEDKELKKIDKENKTRLMTEQEVSDWLCQCPEECREFKYKNCSTVFKAYSYYENKANSSANDILIRRNHGEWQEPLIND